MAHSAERKGVLRFFPYDPARKVRTASSGGFRGNGGEPQNSSDKPPVLRLVKS